MVVPSYAVTVALPSAKARTITLSDTLAISSEELIHVIVDVVGEVTCNCSLCPTSRLSRALSIVSFCGVCTKQPPQPMVKISAVSIQSNLVIVFMFLGACAFFAVVCRRCNNLYQKYGDVRQKLQCNNIL